MGWRTRSAVVGCVRARREVKRGRRLAWERVSACVLKAERDACCTASAPAPAEVT